MGLAESAQFPLNTVGPKGQHAFVGVHRVFFSGATGLVGTSYGIPRVTATRVGTGIYNVLFPNARSVDIIPGMQCPSGAGYEARVVHVSLGGLSSFGLARVHISAPSPTLVPTLGAAVLQNPAAPGTVLNLMFFVAPVTPY